MKLDPRIPLAELFEIICVVFDLEAIDPTADLNLYDGGSLSWMELSVILEERFGSELTAVELSILATASEISAALASMSSDG